MGVRTCFHEAGESEIEWRRFDNSSLMRLELNDDTRGGSIVLCGTAPVEEKRSRQRTMDLQSRNPLHGSRRSILPHRRFHWGLLDWGILG
jgi:hypothetical protein